MSDRQRFWMRQSPWVDALGAVLLLVVLGLALGWGLFELAWWAVRL